MKLAKVIWLVLAPFWASAQIVISSGSALVANKAIISSNVGINNLSTKVDLATSSLFLKGVAGTRGIRTSSPLSVANLTMDSDADYTVAGTWTITNQLILTKGKLVLNSSIPGKLTYTGIDDLQGSDASYVQGLLYIKGSGLRTWPIGDLKGYAPVALQEIDPADASTEIGFDISADPGFVAGGSIKEIFTDRFWQIFVNNPNSTTGGYLGTQISLSSNGTDTFFNGTGDGTILERESGGSTNDLGGSVNNAFLTSTLKTSTSGKFYAIAKTDVVTVKVHKLITPDSDETNNVLYIEGIDNFENEVTILDRWGVPFKKWTNFKNYPIPATAQQADVDFTKLAIGNYIVVVKYKERGVDKSVKQMISVLK